MIVQLADRFGPSGVRMYTCATGPITPPATPTDVFYIGGAAGIIIQVVRMWIVTYQTTAGFNTWRIKKGSTANTGGTAAATTKIPFDSTYSAAQATVQHYTANPTLGTKVGDMWAGILPSVALATVPTGSPTDKAVEVVGDFTPGIFLRGTAESISWNFNGAALPAGMTVFCGAVWTEQG